MGRVFMMQLSSYPSYVLVVGLWGGPYLTHIYGYDLKGRGDILFVAALTQRAGLVLLGAERPAVRPLQGSGDDRRRHLLRLAGAAGGLGTLPVPLLLVVFAMIGFSTGMVSVVMAHGRSLVAPHLLGRTITLLNIGTMGGGFLVQFVSGAIIDLFPITAGAYPLAGLSGGIRASGGPRSGRFRRLFRQPGKPLRPRLSPACRYEQPCSLWVSRLLRFVRRGSILLQRGIELRLDPPPPSLGVSSLDLGRRLADGPFFLGAADRAQPGQGWTSTVTWLRLGTSARRPL